MTAGVSRTAATALPYKTQKSNPASRFRTGHLLHLGTPADCVAFGDYVRLTPGLLESQWTISSAAVTDPKERPRVSRLHMAKPELLYGFRGWTMPRSFHMKVGQVCGLFGLTARPASEGRRAKMVLSIPVSFRMPVSAALWAAILFSLPPRPARLRRYMNYFHPAGPWDRNAVRCLLAPLGLLD